MSTDSFERELRATLKAHAEVDIPAPRIDVLTREGGSMKTRRRLGLAVAGVAAAAAVVAAVAVPVAALRSAPVQPAAPTDTSVPYVQHGVLHLDGLTTPMSEGSFSSGGLVASDVGGSQHLKTAPGLEVGTWTVTYEDHGRLVSRTAPGGSEGMLIAPEGQYVFLIHDVPGGLTATAWDPRTGKTVATRRIAAPTSDLYADQQGRLFVVESTTQRTLTSTMWKPGSAPVPVTGTPKGAVITSTLGGIELFNGRKLYVAGTVGDDGVFHTVTTLPRLTDVVSPDARGYLYEKTQGAGRFAEWAGAPDGSQHRLRLPKHALTIPVGFTDDTHVTVDGFEATQDQESVKRSLGIYSCDLTTGSCNLELPTPRGSGVIPLLDGSDG